LRLLTEAAQFKGLLFNLNVIAKEECRGEKGETNQIERNLYGLFPYLKMAGLRGLVAKDKNIKVFFIQGHSSLFLR
jgi:hypothetical protein